MSSPSGVTDECKLKRAAVDKVKRRENVAMVVGKFGNPIVRVQKQATNICDRILGAFPLDVKLDGKLVSL